jgi:hypothetical protein
MFAPFFLASILAFFINFLRLQSRAYSESKNLKLLIFASFFGSLFSTPKTPTISLVDNSGWVVDVNFGATTSRSDYNCQ